MDPVRPLRDVFADLASDETARQAHAADPTGFLASYGHADLPGDLVGEAIANYADTAPAEVAEHLSPFLLDGGPDPAAGLDLLATAPAVDLTADHTADLDAGTLGDPHELPPLHDLFDLAFGAGDSAGVDEMHHVAPDTHDGPGPDAPGTELGGTELGGTELPDGDEVDPAGLDDLADLTADTAADHAHHPDAQHASTVDEPDDHADAADWADG